MPYNPERFELSPYVQQILDWKEQGMGGGVISLPCKTV